MEKSAMVQRINAESKKTKRQVLTGDALELMGIMVIIAGFIAFMFFGYALGY